VDNNIDSESKTTTQMTEDNGGHSIQEPRLSDNTTEETSHSPTKEATATELELLLFQDNTELKSTRE